MSFLSVVSEDIQIDHNKISLFTLDRAPYIPA